VSSEQHTLWPRISDHQQSRGYEDGSRRGRGHPMLVVADFTLLNYLDSQSAIFKCKIGGENEISPR
ncbi:MAG: hypothetical protein PVI42_15310, partial [Desulfobacterales bacterium]